MFIARHHSTGLFNQILSLETLFGIASLFESESLIYEFDGGINDQTNNESRKKILGEKIPVLSDLVDIPKNDKITFLKGPATNFKNIDLFNSFDENSKKLVDYFINVDASKTSNIDNFSHGREEIDISKDYILNNYNLDYYSHCFFNRNKSFDDIIFNIKIKQEYLDLAKKIAENIGSFNGCHLRKRDHIIIEDISEKDFFEGIGIFDNNKPLILSTDDRDNPFIKNINLIDDIIINDFLSDFQSLPFYNEVVFGLISNLVMHHADDFIGTSTSTFTNYIQRNLNLQGRCNWRYFKNDRFINENPSVVYSWERYPNGGYFYTEWPESNRITD